MNKLEELQQEYLNTAAKIEAANLEVRAEDAIITHIKEEADKVRIDIQQLIVKSADANKAFFIKTISSSLSCLRMRPRITLIETGKSPL